MIKLTHKSWWK